MAGDFLLSSRGDCVARHSFASCPVAQSGDATGKDCERACCRQVRVGLSQPGSSSVLCDSLAGR